MSRILVIDDDSGHRLILKSRLVESGHEVVLADTGARGISDARAQAFDAFVVAARLGAGVDGYEVCKRLKGIPERAHVPVILFNDQTGVHEDLGRAFDAGCDAFVTKPDLPALDHVLRVHVKQKRRLEELSREVGSLHEQIRRLKLPAEPEPARATSNHASGRDSARDAMAANGDHAAALRELACGRPDGMLIVDSEGTVRYADRGACELLGSRIEGHHLGSLAPASGLEAFARDARIEPREGFRFDLPPRKGRAPRSLSAVVVPLMVRPSEQDMGLRVVMFHDAAKRRLAADLLRSNEPSIPRAELGPLVEAAREVFRPEALIGVSHAAEVLRTNVAAAAQHNDPVLIRGDRGSGKERIARILHYHGSSTGAFLQARCSGQTAENLEAELFGYVKGAFRSATADRPGMFQMAQDGTLFLEEITELTLELQQRIAGFLETGSILRMGAQRPERIDLRLVASTSAPIENTVHEGKFSRDLFDRLARRTIHVPTLAARRDDIEPLVRHFVQRFGARRHVHGISDDVLQLLRRHEWPGSLAELEDCIDQACALADGGTIQLDDLPRSLRDVKGKGASSHEIIPTKRSASRPVEGTHSVAGLPSHELTSRPPSSTPLRDVREWDITDADPVSLDLYEMKALLRALDEAGGDKLKAAKILKVGKSTLYRKLKRFDIK
jgi:DNA-binding NtrC family response regulator